MISRVRRWVYQLGFRPRFRTIFFSPSLDLLYASEGIFEAMQEGYKNAMAIDGTYFDDEDLEGLKESLETSLAKMIRDQGLPIGIVTSVHHVPISDSQNPDEIMASIEKAMNRDWFEETSHKVRGSDHKLFFCPLCGSPLDYAIDRMVYWCSEHGGYDFRIGVTNGVREIIVKSIRMPNG